MLEKKVEICNVHLPSDCVDKTWFPGSRNASDCNVHLHIFPSFHFTLKKVCSGIWVTKAILLNFLLKILCIFRFPIHSDRMAGNRAIRSLLRTKVGLQQQQSLIILKGTRDETDPRAFAHVITPRRRVLGCNRCFWDIRLRIYRLPNIYRLLQLVLTKFFKKLAVSVFTGSWSRDQVMQKANIHNLTIIALVWDWLSPA